MRVFGQALKILFCREFTFLGLILLGDGLKPAGIEAEFLMNSIHIINHELFFRQKWDSLIPGIRKFAIPFQRYFLKRG